MCKNELLEVMYEYALEKGFCKNKKSFATFIGISPTNYSKVFADTTEKYCSLNVLLKANNAMGNVFSAQWLIDGTGNMLVDDEPSPLPLAEDTQKISDSRDELIEQLKAELEQQKEFNALQREYVADLKERISEYQERVAELKELIHELKKAQHDASAHRVKNA